MTEKSNRQPNEQPKERHHIGGIILRALAVLFVLVVVLALVVVSTMTNSRFRDQFRRWVTYGGGQEENLFVYSADSGNAFGQVGDYLAVLSQNSLQLLRSDGTAQQDLSVQLDQPALTAGGGLVAAWDTAGSVLTVANGEEGVLLTRDEGDRLLSVRMNRQGWLAVTEEKSGYKGAVTVYNQHQEKVFTFHSSSNFLIDAVVSGDGQALLAVTVGQEAGSFVTRLLCYDLHETEPFARGVLQDGVVLDLADTDGGYTALTDEGLAFINDRTEVTGAYSYRDAYLRDYSLNGSGFAALLLGRYRAGTVGRLVTVDVAGQEIASLDITREVLDISAAGDFVAVLYSDELVVYHSDLTHYASTLGTDLAGHVTVSEDGSALVISADSAWRFLP